MILQAENTADPSISGYDYELLDLSSDIESYLNED
jgi:hypothetical protein